MRWFDFFVFCATWLCHFDYVIFVSQIIKIREKMRYYENLAEMYVGNDISPDFYGWVFPKCDYVAVGTETVCSKQDIKLYQNGVRERVKEKIYGGKVIKVEAHQIPEHPRPRRVRGPVALVCDSAGYVTKYSGEGIYFAAKSGRMCGEEIVRSSMNRVRMIDGKDLRKEYLKKWDSQYINTFRFLDISQKICACDYVQRMTFESYLYKNLARRNPWEDVKMVVNTVGSLIR
ncbi:hypothetical protein MKX01_022519 [Papaver californicum]|nr:hypothetical protein MKX01_022519 [Papaver californicum]